jgi:hypothetical protein
MSWTNRVDYDDERIVKEIDRQEDRGAAVIAGAFLEDFLTDAIRTRLLDGESVLDQFLSGMGPLATFSAKIEMAYLLKDCDNRMQTGDAYCETCKERICTQSRADHFR